MRTSPFGNAETRLVGDSLAKLPKGKKGRVSKNCVSEALRQDRVQALEKRDKDLEAFGEHWNSTIGVSARVGYALMLMSKQGVIGDG